MNGKHLPNVKTSWFLPLWRKDSNREAYENRKGVTPLKVEAIFQLLSYGSKRCDRLSKVAHLAGVSLGTLRVWRTEQSFKELHRQVVWDCANAFVDTFLDTCPVDAERQEGGRKFVNDQIESFEEMGTALQHAVLWRLVVDVMHICTMWPPFIDRIDMLGEVGHIATQRSESRSKNERKGIGQTVQAFVWCALGTLHRSRAGNVQQQQRHFAVTMLIGFKMAQEAYRAAGSSRSEPSATLPFLSGLTDLETMEATFHKLYPSSLDGENAGN